MSREEREGRYQYWREIALNTSNPRMRKAAKKMAIGYKRQLDQMEGK